MRWHVRRQDQERVAALARELSVSPVLAWALMNRGLTDPAAARDFLAPDLEHLRPARPMADSGRAVERIIAALDASETIGVHGDYDVDGITGAVVLCRFLDSLGAKVIWHLPHRQRDGYGLKPAGIESLHDRGATLVLAVDCGISDFEAVDRANQLGVDVIVIDHHQLGDRLPAAHAVLNAQRPDCPFHGQQLSGVGAAFYLLVALRARLRELGRVNENHNLLAYLDLVALGTVADVVPLLGLNRALVRFGLDQMNRGLRPGLVQLRRVARLGSKTLDSDHLSYQLAPRLNAAGRLDSGEVSLRLLLTDNEQEAALLAEKLDEMNQTRRQVEDRILTEALRLLEDRPDLLDAPALVVAGRDWHIGVIGIVASRLMETYHRPVAVIGVHAGMGKGSLRSVPGINIYRALCGCSGLLDAFGGHPMAAGLTVREERIEELRRALCAEVLAGGPAESAEPVLEVDAEWPLSRCDLAQVDELARLRPHGLGNPEPSFCARGVIVKWAREGRSNSMTMGLEEGGVQYSGFGFRLGPPPAAGDRVDIVYTPTRDDYQGRESLRARIRDIKIL